MQGLVGKLHRAAPRMQRDGVTAQGERGCRWAGFKLVYLAEQQGHMHELPATQVAHVCAGVHVEHQRRCHQPAAVQPAGAAADKGKRQDAGEHALPAGGAPQRGLVHVV